MKRIKFRYIKHLKIIGTLIVGISAVAAAIFAYYSLIYSQKSLDLQNKQVRSESMPFFKYAYDTDKKSFRVDGGENIDIIKVDWILAGKWLFDKEKYTLRKINNLDKELSRLDIRNAYGETLVNTLQNWGKDVIECEFFRLTQDATPVMVFVTYDTKEHTKLESKDLLLITRIDTERPNPQVILRNVVKDEIINDFFNKNLWQVKSATEYISEHYKYSNETYNGNLRTYTGKCGILDDQPLEGY